MRIKSARMSTACHDDRDRFQASITPNRPLSKVVSIHQPAFAEYPVGRNLRTPTRSPIRSLFECPTQRISFVPSADTLNHPQLFLTINKEFSRL
jgi:hypothetical protein